MREPLPDPAVVLASLRRLTVPDPEQAQTDELRQALRDGRELLPLLEAKLAEIQAATLDLVGDFKRERRRVARLRRYQRRLYRWLVYPAGTYAGLLLLAFLLLLVFHRQAVLLWVGAHR